MINKYKKKSFSKFIILIEPLLSKNLRFIYKTLWLNKYSCNCLSSIVEHTIKCLTDLDKLNTWPSKLLLTCDTNIFFLKSIEYY